MITGDYLRDHAAHHADRPFFASFNFADPHQPFVVPTPWDQMYAETELHPVKRRQDEAEGKPTAYRATLDRSLGKRGWQASAGVPCQYVRQTGTLERDDEEDAIWPAYLGMISLLDKQVGRILDQLEDSGLAEVILGDGSKGMAGLEHRAGHPGEGRIRIPLAFEAERPVGRERHPVLPRLLEIVVSRDNGIHPSL